MNNLEIMRSFTEEELPNLDVAVLGALELFAETKLPMVDMSVYRRPLVVGSGNAEATGRIIFSQFDAVFASESTVTDKLQNIADIDGVVIISASGEKHAPIIARLSKQHHLPVTLFTSNQDSSARQELDIAGGDRLYVFPKNREPYTYNTSTYMAMILGMTKENPTAIKEFFETTVDKVEWPDFSQIDKYYLIVPNRFAGLVRMLQIKFIELFGRTVARDVETVDYVAHATTVVPAVGELFISFGTEEERNEIWGDVEQRLHIPLPDDADYATMMAIGYYVIGKIQAARPPVFKENIAEYMKKASAVFEHELSVIVE